MRLLGVSLLGVASLAAGCGRDPEAALVGRWTEVGWRYEKCELEVDDAVYPAALLGRGDGRLMRHEFESWHFHADRRFSAHKRDGSVSRGTWKLKGRGHVLELRSANGTSYELYDVKELSRGQLVLHFDIGMEVQGIASLEFQRATDEPSTNPRNRQDLNAFASQARISN